MHGVEADAPITDADAAAAIAGMIRTASGRRGTWREVRTLMSDFGIDRLSPEARARMAAALAAENLATDPPLHGVTRRDTVVLTRIDRPSASSDHDSAPLPKPLSGLVTLRVARPGEPFREVDPAGPVPAGVRWFDVKETSPVDAAEFLALVNPHCESLLDLDMVVDLLTPDPRPKVVPYRHGTVRGASAFRVHLEESDAGVTTESRSKAGVLVFEPIEMIVAQDWIISCWHDAELFRGADRIGEQPQSEPANLADEIDRCWRAQQLNTGGDIASALLYELSLSYKRTARELKMLEEEWELDFFRRPKRLDRDTLLETHAAATVLRDWLVPLNRPGMRKDVERAWFPAITGTPTSGGFERALAADERIGGALKVLSELAATLRGAYDLLQLRQSGFERQSDERFQRGIAIGGAAILIPTLVAGIMGANTWVPGEYGPSSAHWAFVVLLAVVVLSGVAAWALLARAQRKPDDQSGPGRTTRRSRDRRRSSG